MEDRLKKHDFDVAPETGFKTQVSDVLSALFPNGTDDSSIVDDIPILSVASPTHSRQNKHVHNTPGKTPNMTAELDLPTLHGLRIAQIPDAYCDQI